MSVANLSNLQSVQLTRNQLVPDEGPKAIPLLLDYTGAVTEYDLDLLQTIQQGFISMVQTLYIDLSQSSNDLTVVVNGSNQIVVAKAGTQGYYQVLAPNPAKFAFQSASGGVIIPVFLINVPIAGVVWLV
jgi:hypothetical protein